MPEERTLLSYTVSFIVSEETFEDDEGNPATEVRYSIKCNDYICWTEGSDKAGGEEERTFVELQVRHVSKELRGRLEHAANTLGNESYIVAQQLASPTTPEARRRLQRFFEERGKSAENRGRRLLGIKAGRPRRLSTNEKLRLPKRYDELHSRYKAIKLFHNFELEKAEREKRTGFKHEEWKKEWLSIAEKPYPNEGREYLEMVADLDPTISSPSYIARLILARETGYEPAYMERLLAQARKLAKGQSDPT
jgi:hypothetical protein